MVIILDLLASLFAGLGALVLIRWLTRERYVKLEDEFKLSVKTNYDYQVKDFVIGGIVCVALFYLISGKLYIAIPAAVGGLIWGKVSQKRRATATTRKMKDQFLQVLTVFTSSMQGGLNPYQALADTVPSLPSPSKEIIMEVLRRQRITTGLHLADAFQDMADETSWEDLNSLSILFKLYDETGANLVEVVKHLSDLVYEQKSDAKYLDAVTGQIRMTAIILTAVPFVILTGMRLAAPVMVEPLYATFVGICVFIIIVGMVIAGNIVINRMVTRALE
ncbi:MAG: hypothetical protein GX825_03830 [Syntrophomonadaceae bacterium]|nr:hypothetical protein [Syntrophomonadaceae bacterium]